MQTRSKDVEVSGRKFQIVKLPPELGSFILMRMMGASMRMRSAEPVDTKPLTPEQIKEMEESAKKITGADRVRTLSFLLFSGNMDFADFKMIQSGCLRCVSLYEARGGQLLPIPIMNDSGIWTPNQDIEGDFALMSKLTSEVLILCFEDFFGQSGPGPSA